MPTSYYLTPIQIISPPLITASLGHSKDTTLGGSSTKPFNIPRMKAAASTFLRHGHLTSSLDRLKHHNKNVVVCNLPDEVARKIFLACAQLSSDDLCLTMGTSGKVDTANSGGWSWTTITHVCSSWRLQALAYPLLWTYIDFTSSIHHSLTWGRAKTSPLHVISPVTDHTFPLLHRTLQLAHRIKEIHLPSTSISQIRPLVEILAVNPNPALESLFVDVRIPAPKGADNDLMNMDDNYYDPLLIPTAGPPLRKLAYMELRGAPFYLLTSRCTFLTHFHLHDLPMTERPTLRYFLLMLEQLTRLRYLTLDRSFPIDVDLDDHDPNNQSSSSSLKPISLPRLESVALVGSVSEIANILRWIIIPSSARLTGTICALSGLQENLWRLTDALSSHCWGADASSLDALVLTGHEFAPRLTRDFKPNPDFRQSLRIRGFKADCNTSGSPSRDYDGAAIDLTISPDPEQSFITSDPFNGPNLDSIINFSDATIIITLNAIWKALSLFRVKTLVLHDVDMITQKTWSHFLRAFPSLKVLHVTGRAPSGLVWALLLNAISMSSESLSLSSTSSSSLSRTLSGSDPGKPPVHAYGEVRRCDRDGGALVKDLKDIYLHNIDCSSGGFMVAPVAGTPINSLSDLDDSRFIDVLIAALHHRWLTFGGHGGSAGGALSLRSVSILRRCTYVPKKAVEELRRAVPSLNVVCEFGRDALLKEGEEVVDGATYWGRWVGDCSADNGVRKPQRYHRLRTLTALDSNLP